MMFDIRRASTVILQKSLREGFALMVRAARWKGKPVVASTAGSIPLASQRLWEEKDVDT